MQIQRVSAHQLRNRLGEFLNLVYYQGQEIIVEKMKKPMAKITPVKKESGKKKIKFNPPIFPMGGEVRVFPRKQIYDQKRDY